MQPYQVAIQCISKEIKHSTIVGGMGVINIHRSSLLWLIKPVQLENGEKGNKLFFKKKKRLAIPGLFSLFSSFIQTVNSK